MGQIPVSVAKKKVNKHFAGQNNYHGKMRQLKRFFFSITTFGSYRRARLRFVFPHAAFIQFLLDSRITMLPWMHRGMQVWRN